MKDTTAEFTTLQELIWPEPGLSSERDLYLRPEGPQGPDAAGYRLFAQSRVSFDTWFNLFNLSTWMRQCQLQSLAVFLEGTGTLTLTVCACHDTGAVDRYDHVVDLDAQGGAVRLDMSVLLTERGPHRVVYLELHAVEGGAQLRGAAWQTSDPPRRIPKLALAVTTFRREQEVARTIDRFCRFRAQSRLKASLDLIVTDNGRSCEMSPQEGVSLIPNENLGGAGGFTRGLLEAKRRGASHCLFMDDDASIHMESLERTWALLAYAQDPTTAVAGAMISEQHPWAIWENGACFFGRCQPLHMGTDLRRFDQVAQMEWEVAGPPPQSLYGGWWYFAFPIAQAAHLAFPFFVRGDDVSFSLVNDFNIVRLNGVVSFQESFTEKESPQTWYLDLRSHMAHHLSLPALDIGARGVLKIAVWFFLRNLPRMHYETLSALTLAVEDVTQGPAFFDQHADMAARRGALKALTQTEAWRDLEAAGPLPPVRRAPPPAWQRHLMKLSLNGLLLPGFSRLGRKITLEADHRGALGFCWGASEITIVNAARTKVYHVQHSKRRAWREIWRFGKAAFAFMRAYNQLQAEYRARYGDLTSEDYWTAKLSLSPLQDHTQAPDQAPTRPAPSVPLKDAS